MSALFRLSLGAVAIGLCTISLGTAHAQESRGTSGRSILEPARPQRDASPTAAPHTDRAQSDQATTARRHTANFRSSQSVGDGSSQAAEQFFAKCLLTKNQGEVELSELAQQHSQNPEVKQFAQQMIKDHQQMIQQLQQIAGTQAGAVRTNASDATISNSSNSDQANSAAAPAGTGTQQGSAGRASAVSNLPGSSAASDTTSPSATAGETTATQTTDATQLLTAVTISSDAVSQIGQIEQQIAARCLRMTKEELQQKQGADFDKCYIGSTIGAHMHALATLEVLSQSSQGELAKIAQSAQSTVQQHLDRAKELMKQIEGESGSRATANRRSTSNDSSQAERSSSSGTQRQ